MTKRHEPLLLTPARMRSQLDNAIVDLLFHIYCDDRAAARRGLAVREFRYVFGGYRPEGKRLWNNPTQYRWLDKHKMKFAAISPLREYSSQQVWNNCNKLCRLGVLTKTEKDRYGLGAALTYPGTCLGDLRSLLRRAKREDTWSCGVVTMIGINRLKGIPGAEQSWRINLVDQMYRKAILNAGEQYRQVSREITTQIDKCGPMDWSDLLKGVLPVIVIDLNNIVSMHFIEGVIDMLKEHPERLTDDEPVVHRQGQDNRRRAVHSSSPHHRERKRDERLSARA